MENINRYIISQLKRPVDRLKLMAIGNIINILSAKELCLLYDEIAEITDDSNTYDWDAIHKVLPDGVLYRLFQHSDFAAWRQS